MYISASMNYLQDGNYLDIVCPPGVEGTLVNIGYELQEFLQIADELDINPDATLPLYAYHLGLGSNHNIPDNPYREDIYLTNYEIPGLPEFHGDSVQVMLHTPKCLQRSFKRLLPNVEAFADVPRRFPYPIAKMSIQEYIQFNRSYLCDDYDFACPEARHPHQTVWYNLQLRGDCHLDGVHYLLNWR